MARNHTSSSSVTTGVLDCCIFMPPFGNKYLAITTAVPTTSTDKPLTKATPNAVSYSPRNVRKTKIATDEITHTLVMLTPHMRNHSRYLSASCSSWSWAFSYTILNAFYIIVRGIGASQNRRLAIRIIFLPRHDQFSTALRFVLFQTFAPLTHRRQRDAEFRGHINEALPFLLHLQKVILGHQ